MDGVPTDLVGVAVTDDDIDVVPLWEALASGDSVIDALGLTVGGERDIVGRELEDEMLNDDDVDRLQDFVSVGSAEIDLIDAVTSRDNDDVVEVVLDTVCVFEVLIVLLCDVSSERDFVAERACRETDGESLMLMLRVRLGSSVGRRVEVRDTSDDDEPVSENVIEGDNDHERVGVAEVVTECEVEG